MSHSGHHKSALGFAVFSALALQPHVSLAQDSGGLAVDLSFAQGLVFEDDDFFTRSDLGLFVLSQTRSQRLAFNFDTGLEFGEGRRDDLNDPSARLSYTLENKSTAFNLDLSAREGDIEALVLEDPLNSTTLTSEDGTRTDRSAVASLEFGRQSPFGGVLSQSFSETEYDSSSTSLIDNTIVGTSLTLRFDLDQRISTRLSFDVTDTDRDGGVDLYRTAVGLGADFAISQTLTASADLGQTRLTESGSVPETVSEGLFFRLALSKELSNGSLSGSLDTDIDENGRVSTARIARDLDLPLGSLQTSFGFSQTDETDNLEPLYGLTWNQDLPRGAITLSVEQQFGTNSIGSQVLNSRINLQAQQELSSLADLQIGLGLRRADVTGGIQTDQFDLSIDYTRELNQNWTFVGNYEHTRRSGANTTTDDTLYLGLRTAVGWRP